MKRLSILLVLLAALAGCGTNTTTSSSSGTSMASVASALAAHKSALRSAAAVPIYDQQMQALQLFVGMFNNAAPGADNLNQATQLLSGGMSTETLAELLASLPAFKNNFYADTLSNLQFGTQFMDNLVGTAASAANKADIASQIASVLNSGYMNRGQVMNLVISRLSLVSSSDPNWGQAALQFNNRVNVAYYQAVTMAVASADLSLLQQVTYDSATVTAVEATITGTASGTWSAMGSGLGSPVNALTYYNGALYAASYGVSVWDGSQWSDRSIGLKVQFGAGDTYALAVSNNNTLYTGGQFFVLTPAGNWYNYAARYANGSWTTCGSGTGVDGSGMSDQVNAMIDYNGQLYAGGRFTSAGGDPLYPQDALYIARFDGSRWYAVGGGMNNTVTDLAVYNGKLIASGYFTQAGGVAANYIAQWDGTTWQPLGSGTDGKVTALAVYNGALYAGGSFHTAGGVAALNIAKWDGQAWSAVGTGVTGTQIYTLAVYNNALYAGGADLWTPDGSQTTGILKWDGSQWKTVGTGTNGPVITLMAMPDGSGLIVGGSFTSAGGVAVANIAKYK